MIMLFSLSSTLNRISEEKLLKSSSDTTAIGTLFPYNTLATIDPVAIIGSQKILMMAAGA
jgi:hypothetical protein